MSAKLMKWILKSYYIGDVIRIKYSKERVHNLSVKVKIMLMYELVMV